MREFKYNYSTCINYDKTLIEKDTYLSSISKLENIHSYVDPMLRYLILFLCIENIPIRWRLLSTIKFHYRLTKLNVTKIMTHL